MASTSETGHAKNVANFQDLIEFVTAYGATYNPSKNNLQLPQLITPKAARKENTTTRKNNKPLYKQLINS